MNALMTTIAALWLASGALCALTYLAYRVGERTLSAARGSLALFLVSTALLAVAAVLATAGTTPPTIQLPTL